MPAAPGESRRGGQSGGPVYLVDASIYVFRAWFSIPDGFSDPAGRPTNAVYGFARFLCELLEETRTSHLALAFDVSLTSSFRNELYPAYKANREPAPPELKRQFAWCRDLGKSLGIPVYADERYEADDLIATLAACWRARGRQLGIISSDKDLAQLIGEQDTWWDFARKRRLNGREVERHFGVRPEQIPDYLALTGDPTDNIPGMPGVGPKTAAALLGHFGDLDELFARADEIAHLKFRGARKLASGLERHRETILLARRLTRLESRVPGVIDDPDVQRRAGDGDALDALLDSLGFGRPLRERLHRVMGV